jgi:hypothetical protein
MPRKRPQYGPAYQRVRKALLGQPCQMRLVCEGSPADSCDHDPPVSRHTHVEGTGCCALRPACLPCQHKQARILAGQSATFRKHGLTVPRQTGKVLPADMAAFASRVWW